MPDVVVTVPKRLWTGWIEEGDAVGEPVTGEEWGFSTWGGKPNIAPGDRVYIVAHGRLRGYAPLTRLEFSPANGSKNPRARGRVAFGRRGGAVACTLKVPIRGFRGWQYAWFERNVVIPFPDWKTAGVDGA